MFLLTIVAALAQAYGTPPTATPPAIAAAPAPAATPVVRRTVKDLPNTTTTYYDVSGRSGPAIERSLKKLLSDPALKNKVELMAWNVGAQVTKRTVGDKCTVGGVKATLNAEVRLPRLADEPKVPAAVLANWRTYVAGVESEAADNLWFISDQLREIEKTMVGRSCDQATPGWNAGLETLKLRVAEFAAQRAKAARKPAR